MGFFKERRERREKEKKEKELLKHMAEETAVEELEDSSDAEGCEPEEDSEEAVFEEEDTAEEDTEDIDETAKEDVGIEKTAENTEIEETAENTDATAGKNEEAEDTAVAGETAEETAETNETAAENAETNESTEETAEAEETAEKPAASNGISEDSEEKTEEPDPTAEDAGESGDVSVEESSEPAAEASEEQEKKGFFRRLFQGLSKTRNNFGFGSLFRGFSKIDDEFYEELEEVLVMGDIGVRATESIIENLQEKVKENHIKEPAECRKYLIESIKEQMAVGETAYRFEQETSVLLVIGVNGVGKTTTIGKLAGKMKAQHKKVVLAAADTFRAAAGEQLGEWARRAGVDMIGGQEGADPGSVLFDAIAAAKSRHADILICDTAGRLQNKKNLMEELKKLNRIIDREYPEAYRETLVVLDATTGQNALSQARQFNEVADITGIVLTKMDGTAKGGIAVAIQSELGIPVKYIGVGETIDDLQKFDSDRFVEALFDQEEEE
jgi:fused signal recognition particle receptor